MAATASVQECTGAGAGSWATVTAAKFCTADDNNPGTTNPIPIPAAGTKYSYWKSHCLQFTGAFTSITDIEIYTDGGGFGTGITCSVGTETIAEASYVQSTGTPGDTGTEMVAGHSGVTGKADLFGYTSGGTKSVDAGPYTSADDRCKHVVLQLDVISTATSGELTPETITFQYDEV